MEKSKYGNNRFGGARFGGATFGGNEYGASAPKDKPKTRYGTPGPFIRGAYAGKSSQPKSVKGTVRSGGVGYSGAKGDVDQNPKISGGTPKMKAAEPKVSGKIGAWKTTVTPAKASKPKSASSGPNRQTLGDFYLAANPVGSPIYKRNKKT